MRRLFSLACGEAISVNLRFGVAFPVADERSPSSLLERSVEAMRAARVHPTRRYDVILGSATPDADADEPNQVIDLDALERRLRPAEGRERGAAGRGRVDPGG